MTLWHTIRPDVIIRMVIWYIFRADTALYLMIVTTMIINCFILFILPTHDAIYTIGPMKRKQYYLDDNIFVDDRNHTNGRVLNNV